jgi:hypothetical protein
MRIDRTKMAGENDIVIHSELWKALLEFVRNKQRIALGRVMSDKEYSDICKWRGVHEALMSIESRLLNPDRIIDDIEKQQLDVVTSMSGSGNHSK